MTIKKINNKRDLRNSISQIILVLDELIEFYEMSEDKENSLKESLDILRRTSSELTLEILEELQDS